MYKIKYPPLLEKSKDHFQRNTILGSAPEPNVLHNLTLNIKILITSQVKTFVLTKQRTKLNVREKELINSLALEMDIHSLAHHLCKM